MQDVENEVMVAYFRITSGSIWNAHLSGKKRKIIALGGVDSPPVSNPRPSMELKSVTVCYLTP